MKYLHKLTLVPLATLLLAGCSGPTAIQSSTETDDLYYASTDKTVFASKPTAAVTENNVATEANMNTNSDEVANPEYSGTTGNNRSNGDSYSDYDYYSEDYTYASRIRRFNSPYRGMSYYDFAYTDPYWYGSGFNAYNPFYDPFSYGYGSGFYRPGFYTGLSIGLGFGNPFFSPYGGYGGFYSPYRYGGGLFGYRNGFNNGYYNGFYNGYYANGGNYDRYPTNYRPRNYGPRTERSVVPTDRNNAGGRVAPNTGSRIGDNTAGRPARVVNGGGLVAPNTGNTSGLRTSDNAGTVQPQGRAVRGARTGVVTPVDAGTVSTPNNQPARVSTDNNNGYRPSTRPARRFEGTISNDATAPTPPSFPAETQRQSRPARVIESQPRTFEAPRRETRSQEIFRTQPAPQRNDTWSQPSRSSFPSGGGSNGGGGGGSSSGGRPRRN